jgi:hypothetical protein
MSRVEEIDKQLEQIKDKTDVDSINLTKKLIIEKVMAEQEKIQMRLSAYDSNEKDKKAVSEKEKERLKNMFGF